MSNPPNVSGIANCEPDNATARQIIAQCVTQFPSNNTDCNQFLKAVARPYFGDGVFGGLNADEIVAQVTKAGSGWVTSKQIPDAISAAKNGQFVGAGMTSADLQPYNPGTEHGHLAVVIGCDGQLSGTTIVPIGYAGSLGNPAARIAGARLSGTFPALAVRSQQVTYFYRTPTQAPATSGFNALVAHIAGSPNMAWGKCVAPAFKERVVSLSAAIGCNADHLMACMAFETGETFSPSIRNSQSGAVGLIQFLPSTAKSLGTTADALANMTAVAQLDYVEKYFSPWKGRVGTLADLYMAILAPFAIGKPDSTPLYTQGTPAYEQNKGLDHDMDGVITKAEATSHAQEKLNIGSDAAHYG